MKSNFKYLFAAIIRTQGKRMALLADALQSISFQRPECLAVVVVHLPNNSAKSDETIQQITQLCHNISDLHYVICHAGEEGRKRGYPLNVGLHFCYEMQNEPEAILFLDDDDIIYPFFTQKMAQAFKAADVDLIYAASNMRHPGHFPEPAYQPWCITHLFVENFMPINSYAVRLRALKSKNLLFDETLDYTEDWYFLLRLLEFGLRFSPIKDTVSEFRMVSDGNLEQKIHQDIWKQASLKIRNYINNTRFSIDGYTLVCSLNSTAPDSCILPDESCAESEYNPEQEIIDPRAMQLWEAARRIWNRMPFFVKRALLKIYAEYSGR